MPEYWFAATYFLLLAGFSLGLGSVTVIDLIGFLGRTSTYWTETATRAHKVTKPLIWVGMFLVSVGGGMWYYPLGFVTTARIQLVLAVCMLLNGFFLSFRVSPFLCDRERQGTAQELLPARWQKKIFVSFLISFCGWWGNVLLFALSFAAHTAR